jgi:hypothetical protein
MVYFFTFQENEMPFQMGVFCTGFNPISFVNERAALYFNRMVEIKTQRVIRAFLFVKTGKNRIFAIL